MNARQIVIILTSVLLSATDIVGQEIHPFVKGGLTIGLFDGFAASKEDVGHMGFNFGGGVQIPLTKNNKTFLEPSLNLISKGNVYEPEKAGGRVTFDLLFVETQVDLVFRGRMGSHWVFVVGTGLYGAYGIGGKATSTNGVTWYRGIPVGGSPSMYDDVVGANRWDVGWRFVTIGVDYHHFMFRLEYELGFLEQFNKTFYYNSSEKYRGGNASYSLNLGYRF